MKKFKFFSLIAFLALAVIPSLTGCGAKMHDYVKDCKLESNISYTATNFLDGGIGEVTLKNNVDGDTAHFYQKEEKNRVVKVRFLGVDTPESTGKIESYGKAAAKFTATKLLEAKTIVLSVDLPNIGKPAEFDSTGTRYVGFVWIGDVENCPMEDLKLLNLMIVQEGYSNAKSITESPLAQYFLDADMQAQDLKKGQWAGEDKDPYPVAEGAANETDIKTLMDAFESDGEDTVWKDAKVGITGTVYKVVGTDCYLNEWIVDPVTGEEELYGIFIFAGYKNYKPLKQLGAVIHVIGTFQIHYGNPQITNVSYDSLHPGPDNMSIVKPAEEGSIRIPERTTSEIVDNPLRLNTLATLKNLTATGGYNEVDQTTLVASGAMSIYCEDSSGVSITFRVPDDVWVKNDKGERVTDYQYFMVPGLTFNVTGAVALFQSTSGSGRITYQITLCHFSDVTLNPIA
jgi:micrococcal nuclease